MRYRLRTLMIVAILGGALIGSFGRVVAWDSRFFGNFWYMLRHGYIIFPIADPPAKYFGIHVSWMIGPMLLAALAIAFCAWYPHLLRHDRKGG